MPKESLGVTTKVVQGTSGAKIYITPTGVVKVGDPSTEIGRRVILQGRFCASIDAPIVPRIIAINEAAGSYSMEKLIKLPDHLLDHKRLFMTMLEDLFKWFWTGDHGFTPDNLGWKDNHWSYISEKAKAFCPELLPLLEKKFMALDHDELRPGLIHGDPTFDNCMMREDGGLVIIDPIPAGYSIPNLVCVDIGKLLQSAAGYEEIKYQRPMIGLSFPEALRIMNLDSVERAGAIYFCCAHYVRLLPYQSEELRKQFVVILKAILEF